MPKVEVNQVAEVAKRIQLEPQKLRELVEELNILTQAEADEERPPAIKKQFVILISDPDDQLPSADFAGWVLQIPEDESPATTQERIIQAAYNYNTTKKGRLYPAKTLGEALENIAGKFFKEHELWVKTKIPVLMLRTNNEIPDIRQGKLFNSTKEAS